MMPPHATRRQLHQVPAVRNLAQAVFELEQGQSRQQLGQILHALQDWLADEASAPLRRHLTAWLKHELRRSRRRSTIAQALEQHPDWLEPSMKLHEKLDLWYDQAVEEGEHRGEHKGLAKAVAYQAGLRFGELPEWAHERLRQASDEQLYRWLGAMLDVGSLQELFER